MINESVYMATFYMQWLMILLLSVGVITLFKKQLDVKLGMRHHGMDQGKPFPITSIQAINGEHHLVGIQQAQPTIFIMTSAGCGACATLYPCLNRVAQRTRGTQFVLMVMGEHQEVLELANKYELNIPVGILTESMMESTETSIFPFAYALSASHKVVAKGTLNNEEHLRLLLESDDFLIAEKTA